MQKADAVMYQSKRNGRSRITVHGTHATPAHHSDEDAAELYSQA
jgi:hypothetical protein